MEPNDPGAPGVRVTTGTLMRRLVAGVALAVAAFVAVRWSALALVGADDLVSLLAGTGGAILVAALALRRAVAPMIARQVDLQGRYEAALADALRDPLTGLGNHRAFHEELDRQVAASQRYGVPLALLLIDLDEFKSINDGRGHAGGDRLLRGFGTLLSVALRRADRPFRVGGDEFAVLLPHTDAKGARVVARRLLAQALQPTLRGDDLQPVSFSGGISAMPELSTGSAQLYSQADVALYVAKRGGRTDVVSFDPSMAAGPLDGSASASSVAEVIARGQLRAVYQPIVALATGHVIGMEGLIRPLPPAPFADPAALFAAAEASGRLTALDLACIDTIVAGAHALPPDQFLSVNLSPPTIEAPELSSGALLAILARHAFPPQRLVLELTERQQIHDPERVRARLDACRRAGIRIAADDIGAGNAGLRLLAEIRFDVLKVDLTLVQRSAEDQSSAVLRSVVELAARTGALVVAEGIEHASQVAQMAEIGIGVGQGYHLGRPGPIDATAPSLERTAGGVSAWRRSMGLPIS